jgi:uncharacterized protein (TIGR02231 family)
MIKMPHSYNTHSPLKYQLTALALGLCVIQHSFAVSIDSAPIKTVTLYPNSALVERNVSVSAGQRVVSLENLPANFDIAQLQVTASNQIQVGNITSKDNATDKPTSPAAIQLSDKIQHLQDQISLLDIESQAAELQNRYLERLTSPVSATTSVKQQALDSFNTIRKTQIAKRNLEQQLKALQNDLASLGNIKYKQRHLDIQVYAPQNGQLTLRYLVRQATWQPFYKATLSTKSNELTLERFALISQNTGEDWSNVALTLSTGQPTTNVTTINPSPWSVTYQPPQPPARQLSRARVDASYELGVASPAPIMMAPPTEDGAGIAQYQQIDTPYTTLFHTHGLNTVPSSNEQTTIPLTSQKSIADISVQVVPRQAALAILNAEVTQPEGVWPSGVVKLYRDGDYIGQSNWQTSADQKLNFSFGEDPLVNVTVKDLANTNDKTSTFGSNRQKTFEQVYQVKNLHKTPINMILLESVPQSQSNQVKIESQFSEAPTEKSWQNQDNIYQWRKTIDPKAQFDLKLSYQFTYPKTGYVNGLPE